jgi:ADP-ribose pyrophosphatase YjhB (NUDIX family)
MKESAGIVVKVKDKCLVCKRSKENSEGEKWAIPMGGIEEGEDPKDAAYREFIEEMGVDIDGDIEFVGKINRFNKQGIQKSILHVFLYETNQRLIPDLENAKDGLLEQQNKIENQYHQLKEDINQLEQLNKHN